MVKKNYLINICSNELKILPEALSRFFVCHESTKVIKNSENYVTRRFTFSFIVKRVQNSTVKNPYEKYYTFITSSFTSYHLECLREMAYFAKINVESSNWKGRRRVALMTKSKYVNVVLGTEIENSTCYH